jgi:phosphoglucosamine mutase
MRFGTDGVRGVANGDLTAAFALDLGRAAARVLDASVAVVGGDTRRSTPMLEAALVAGLTTEGVEVHRLGVVPTPAVAHHAATLGAMGAVVSASHNPYHDNGIKLFAPGGTKLGDDVERRIERALASLGPPATEPGAVVEHPGIDDDYLEHLTSALEGRSLGRRRVVVDAANGAASFLAGPALAGAGADVVVLHAEPDGTNINRACGATAPASLAAAVVEHGAWAGIALDGDADRLIAVDERGRVVDGDHVLAILAGDLRRRGRLAHDTVVVTVMTNLGFRHAMHAAQIDVVETPVGDRYVLDALARGGYTLGGEQSGHVILPELATTGDGLLTGLVLLDACARDGRAVSEIAASAMTQLPQVLVNVAVDAALPDVAIEFAAEIERAAASLGEAGRILVRASGTEPLVRVMVEAPTHAQATAVADEVAGVIRRVHGRSAS